jgi:hypothetical protein
MLSKLGYASILLAYSCGRFVQSLVSNAKIPGQFAKCLLLRLSISEVGTGSVEETLILSL